MSSVQELTTGEFTKFTEKGLVLIDFFAEWCMPCLMMGPILDEVSQKFKGKMKFGKVNVDESGALAGKFEVSSIPCFILFKDGKAVARFVGGMPAEDLEEKLRKFL